MRLITFEKEGRPSLGVRFGTGIVDLSVALPDLPDNWPEVFAGLHLAAVEAATLDAPPEARLPLEGLKLLPPIVNPPKIICIGLNYHAHAAEVGAEVPDYPVVFSRYPASLVGDGEPLVRPKVSEQFDYEVELAVIIGKGGRGIAEADALGHVVGYSVINEGSLRDYQFKSSQWVMGKTFDRSGAFGPDIVTIDELRPGAAGLKLFCRLNDKVVQEGDTDDMIFSVARIVSELSTVMTLEPGDVISTGTPPGVGLGRKPPLWMKPGDVCEVEIEQIGVLRNLVIDEV
jgi:2-keto-4-pentenoate hydratase/2-oxohepta-3-ene-1,7-dioic acid hydratase in catechol pathway